MCLTVILAEAGEIHADVGPETVRVTTLGTMARGSLVNLERPMRADGRFGGHFVQGHVDAIGHIEDLRADAEFHWMTVVFPTELAAYIVHKGSIAVDGISLTVAGLGADRFDVQVVPYHDRAHQPEARAGARPRESRVRHHREIRRARRAARGADAGGRAPRRGEALIMEIAKGARKRRGPFARIEDAIAEIRAGRMVIVVDDEGRENEGDLTIAAEKITAEAITFMARYGCGLICLSMTPERLDELEIPLMVANNSSRFDTAFCVPIEAKGRTTTGISAGDRAATVRAAIDPATRPADLARPGHMFPLRSRTGGVTVRAGQTEAAVDLARIAGLYPAGVICEIMNEDGTMARVPELTRFAKRHGLLVVTIADLIKYRMRTESLVKRVASAQLPTRYGPFTVHAFENLVDNQTHVALVCGDIGDGKNVLVRVHSQCLTGDVLHSIRCDCGAQLDTAMQRIAAEGRGVLLYLNQEGRGIGLANKIRAYELQDEGFDTVEANERLGFKADQRDYGMGVQILRELGVRMMRLLSNNPRKLVGIEGYGLSVSEWLPLEIPASDSTRRYLKTKKDKLGHKLSSV